MQDSQAEVAVMGCPRLENRGEAGKGEEKRQLSWELLDLSGQDTMEKKVGGASS